MNGCKFTFAVVFNYTAVYYSYFVILWVISLWTRKIVLGLKGLSLFNITAAKTGVRVRVRVRLAVGLSIHNRE